MRNQEEKRRQEETVEIPEAKRRTPSLVPRVLARKTTEATLSRQVNTQVSTGEPEWQMVSRKKKKDKQKNKKPQERKIKPDAIMIASRDNTSYADILRKVKTDPKLSTLGET